MNMGDRALIVVTDGERVSPVIYLHWGGHSVPTLIEQLALLMKPRGADVDYAAARLVGLAHEMIPGPLSLGMWNATESLQRRVRDQAAGIDRSYYLDQESHGDAGFIVVRADQDYDWQSFRGYLTKREAA
jgi:hypothetical protein